MILVNEFGIDEPLSYRDQNCQKIDASKGNSLRHVTYWLTRHLSGIEENKLTYLALIRMSNNLVYFAETQEVKRNYYNSLATRSKDTNWSFFLFLITLNSHAFISSDFLAYFSFMGEKNP